MDFLTLFVKKRKNMFLSGGGGCVVGCGVKAGSIGGTGTVGIGQHPPREGGGSRADN